MTCRYAYTARAARLLCATKKESKTYTRYSFLPGSVNPSTRWMIIEQKPDRLSIIVCASASDVPYSCPSVVCPLRRTVLRLVYSYPLERWMRSVGNVEKVSSFSTK